MPDYNRIREIQDFESLVDYLNDELDWPIDVDDLEDITFDYEPEEFGLEEAHIVKTKSIKQLRPLVPNQPWGIFYIEFESKRLPVVVLRRILRALVRKKRHSAAQADLPAWNLNDLLFISALGEDEHRGISFAHFRDSSDGQPQLRTFSWDRRETHFYYLRNLNLENLRWPKDDGDAKTWREQWSSAFTTEHRWQIGASKDLSLELAQLARRTRALVREVYNYELKTGPLHHLYESFRTVLVHDLDLDGFADMVAQTIAYGLFSACATGEAVLGLSHLEAMVPNTNPFLRELFAEFTRISGYQRHQIDFDELGVSELVELLNDTDMESVLRDFGRQTGGGVEDPVIHFYELFLNEYDKQQKVQRGVFYTPKPVVSFIVRSVHELLRTEFGLEDGLADTTTWGEMINRNKALKLPEGASLDEPFVQILDPATGTGTFLETVIDVIYETMTAKWWTERKNRSQVREAWNEYVPKHLLPRLHGFELMMAPYAVAHMKLGLKLSQTGYDFKAGERLRVYLTNTLEPPREGESQLELELIPEFLSHEAKAADEVKHNTPITVMLGNPPYLGHSTNRSRNEHGELTFIGKLIEDYKEGCPELHKPAQAKWLQDDYVKFIRLAQWRIEQTGEGIIGYITNHSYLDNPTFRGMRQSLMETFSEITVYDLHGNTRKKEKTPEGGKDENVFDIQQGVAILLCVKENGENKPTIVCHSDLWGPREAKYNHLAETDTSDIQWEKLQPSPSFYLFVPQDIELLDEYNQGWKIPDIFSENGDPAPGIVTTHDQFAVAFTSDGIIENVEKLLATTTEEEARRQFRLCRQSQWNYATAKMELANSEWQTQIVPLLYRPFDLRWTVYNRYVAVHRRERATRHMLTGENIALITSRLTKGETFKHAQVTTNVVEVICMSPKTSNNGFVFPLYLYPDASEVGFHTRYRCPNLNPAFLKALAKTLNLHQTKLHGLPVGITPEDILHYTYAIFHSPIYRERYAEFLKIDFPRLPLTDDLYLFRTLCAKGAELVSLHLMESSQLDNFITTFHDSGDRQITKVGETGKTLTKIHDGKGRLHINRTAYFDNVPLDVWEFHIGGYQVCHKWLDDRKTAKRSLSNEDIIHYQRIIVALKETIRLMAEIDEVIDAYGGWPLPGSTSG